MPKKTHQRAHFYRRKWFLWTAGSVLAVAFATLLAFRLSPWPGAMIIRAVFDRGSHKTLVGLRQAIPAQPVTVLHDQRYGKNSAETLDAYIPNEAISAHQMLPVVVWTHGGAWLSGDKEDAAPYYSLLAHQGFVVVSLNYTLAPKKAYPTQLRELNDAYAYMQANAARLYANTHKVMLAGDSAGSQLSSQMAAIISDAAYAKEVGVQPTLMRSRLAGVVLFCGIYKVEGLAEPSPTLPKLVSWGSDVSVWAYLGTRDKQSPLIRQASPYYHVTKDFPATFISGGNGDPLTSAQSMPFARLLASLNVPVTTLFYPPNHTPRLPHEYQFTFDTDGKQAFAQMVQFLQRQSLDR